MPRSPECAGIEVVSGTVVLLWQVLAKPVISACTPVLAAEKGLRWWWSAVERAAFKSSKELLTLSKLLVHYDPKLDLVLV